MTPFLCTLTPLFFKAMGHSDPLLSDFSVITAVKRNLSVEPNLNVLMRYYSINLKLKFWHPFKFIEFLGKSFYIYVCIKIFI